MEKIHWPYDSPQKFGNLFLDAVDLEWNGRAQKKLEIPEYQLKIDRDALEIHGELTSSTLET